MKSTIPTIVLILILCVGLAGCISVSQPDGATVKPVQSTAQEVSMESPPPEDSDEPSVAPATNASPAASSVQASERLAGLAEHYPWDRVPLPKGSLIVKVENVQDTDKYIEYSYVTLPMTKAEAIAYFQPLLEKEANFFTLDDNLEHPPMEILGAYPDVASFVSLYSRYTREAEENIGVILVNLYTPADKETVLVAVVQVNYLTKP